MLAEFGSFINVHQKICDEHVHVQLQYNLVEHLRARKGNAPCCVSSSIEMLV
jgi:hypothetical protein